MAVTPLNPAGYQVIYLTNNAATITLDCITNGVPGQEIRIAKSRGTNLISVRHNQSCTGGNGKIYTEFIDGAGAGSTHGPYNRTVMDFVYLTTTEADLTGWHMISEF